MRTILVLLSLVVFQGCQRNEPTLAGGKPVNHWLQTATDPDAKVRQKGIAKLGNVGSLDLQVFPTLIAALKDRDPKVRCEAILAIVKYGPGTGVAIEPLNATQTKDSDPKVREYAAKAVQKLTDASASMR
jgi:HEAT repeat protein